MYVHVLSPQALAADRDGARQDVRGAWCVVRGASPKPLSATRNFSIVLSLSKRKYATEAPSPVRFWGHHTTATSGAPPGLRPPAASSDDERCGLLSSSASATAFSPTLTRSS
jgi:hypothetical protein